MSASDIISPTAANATRRTARNAVGLLQDSEPITLTLVRSVSRFTKLVGYQAL